MTFTIGDYVELVECDGVVFAGILDDFTDQYVLVNGLGHLHDNIMVMTHG